MEALVFWMIIWGMWGVVGFAVGNIKGKPSEGFLLGFLLGPIGVIVASIVLKKEEPTQFSRNKYYERSRIPRPRKKKRIIYEEEESSDEHEAPEVKSTKKIVAPKRKRRLNQRKW